MDDDVYVIDMPLSDALAAIRMIAAQIEEIGMYCPKCGEKLIDGAVHRCVIIDDHVYGVSPVEKAYEAVQEVKILEELLRRSENNQ